jgi:hypothetical protein
VKLVKESEYYAIDKGKVPEIVGLAVMITRQVTWDGKEWLQGVKAVEDGTHGRKWGWDEPPLLYFFFF